MCVCVCVCVCEVCVRCVCVCVCMCVHVCARERCVYVYNDTHIVSDGTEPCIMYNT